MSNESIPQPLSPETPTIELLEAEQTSQLYEAIQDEIVTMYGVTDTFGNLVKKCPHNLDSISAEKKEQWATKALETSSEETREKYAHLRAEPKANPEKPEESAKSAKVEEAVRLRHVDGTKKIGTAPQAKEKGAPTVIETLNEAPASQAREVSLQTAVETPAATVESSESVAPQQGGGGPSDQELESLTQVQSNTSYETTTPSKPEPKVATFIKRVSQTIKLKLELPVPEAVPSPVLIVQITENNSEIEPQELGELITPEGIPPESQLAELHNSVNAEVESEPVQEQEPFYKYLTEVPTIVENIQDAYMQPVLSTPESVTDEQFAQLMDAAFPHEATNPVFEATTIEDDPEQVNIRVITDALPPDMKAKLRVLAAEDTPEAELLIESMETMTLVVERLQKLCKTKRSNSIEVGQIEQVLVEYYEQLCAIAHHEVIIEEQEAFIAALKAYDKGTHEDKQGIFTQPQQPTRDTRTTRLARFILQIGTVHFAEQLV